MTHTGPTRVTPHVAPHVAPHATPVATPVAHVAAQLRAGSAFAAQPPRTPAHRTPARRPTEAQKRAALERELRTEIDRLEGIVSQQGLHLQWLAQLLAETRNTANVNYLAHQTQLNDIERRLNEQGWFDRHAHSLTVWPPATGEKK